jgi:hypothetical protein
MNERIKELAEQARAEVRADWAKGNKIPYPEAHYAFQRDNDQKFAELIVRECADILMIPEHVMNHHQELTDYYRGWVNGRLLGIEHIKEHFGVEE